MIRAIAATFELALAPTDAAPGRARAELTAWLGQATHNDVLIDDLRLLASELVTNCIRHARITPGQALRLTATLRATTLRLELHDYGTDGTVARRMPRQRDGAGGYGLNLVAQLASAWGVDRDADGTTVWFELASGERATA